MIWWILGRSPDGFLASGVRAASEKSQVEASEVTLPSPSSVSGQDDKSKLHHRRQQCGGPRSPARPSAPHENDGLFSDRGEVQQLRTSAGFRQDAAASRASTRSETGQRGKGRSTAPAPAPPQAAPGGDGRTPPHGELSLAGPGPGPAALATEDGHGHGRQR